MRVPALSDEFSAEQRIAELEQTARRLQRRLVQAEAKTAELVAATYEAAHDAMAVAGRPKPVPSPKAAAGKGDPEACLIHYSDWQLGKICGEPGGLDRYDIDECISRVRFVTERARRITAVQRKDHPVPECVVLFGGDMVEGVNIYPGQAHHVQSTGYEQLMTAANLMAEVVLTLLQDFEHVHVYSVHGNHGRIGRRGDYPREDNLDLIAYAIARQQLSAQERVTWEENLGWYAHVEVGRYSALLLHGDQVKSFGGTPAAALARRAAAWSSSMPFAWTDLYLGHYHQNLVLTLPNGGQVRLVPSVERGSQYAAEFMASRGRGGQRIVYIRPDKGTVTGEYMVWLD